MWFTQLLEQLLPQRWHLGRVFHYFLFLACRLPLFRFRLFFLLRFILFVLGACCCCTLRFCSG